MSRKRAELLAEALGCAAVLAGLALISLPVALLIGGAAVIAVTNAPRRKGNR